jgi:hypothetical protein
MRQVCAGLSLLAVAYLATGCGQLDVSMDAGESTATKVRLPASAVSTTAVTTLATAPEGVPTIQNPYEELQEFDPRGVLRWSEVAGAEAYEVWAFNDPGRTQLAEFSKALVSRQYQFTQLAGGKTYYVKVYFRVNGAWSEIPAFTLKTTTNVIKHGGHAALDGGGGGRHV